MLDSDPSEGQAERNGVADEDNTGRSLRLLVHTVLLFEPEYSSFEIDNGALDPGKSPGDLLVVALSVARGSDQRREHLRMKRGLTADAVQFPPKHFAHHPHFLTNSAKLPSHELQ